MLRQGIDTRGLILETRRDRTSGTEQLLSPHNILGRTTVIVRPSLIPRFHAQGSGIKVLHTS